MGVYQSKYTGAEIDELLDKAGSGMTKTVLFEGSLNSVGTANLTDSVLNYDMIIVVGCCDINTSSTNALRSERVILPEDILFMDETGTTAGSYNIYESNNTDSFHRECFVFNNARQIKTTIVANGGNWVNARISKIVGIKY